MPPQLSFGSSCACAPPRQHSTATNRHILFTIAAFARLYMFMPPVLESYKGRADELLSPSLPLPLRRQVYAFVRQGDVQLQHLAAVGALHLYVHGIVRDLGVAANHGQNIFLQAGQIFRRVFMAPLVGDDDPVSYTHLR